MILEFQAFMIEGILHGLIYHMRLAYEILRAVHSTPLEGSEGLRHEKGSRACHLYPDPLALLLWNSIEIIHGHIIGKIRYCQHILIALSRKPHHEIKLHLAVAGFKADSRALHYVLCCYSLIDHISHALASCLRREGQRSLFGILDGFHHIQEYMIDTK